MPASTAQKLARVVHCATWLAVVRGGLQDEWNPSTRRSIACSSTVTIPEGNVAIEDRAFEGCASLTDISLPSSLVRIGSYSFGGCKSLVSVVVPNSVTQIGTGAFSNCSSLVNVSFSTSVVGSLAPFLFSRCRALSSVTGLSDSITVIGESAFLSCTSLESISLPTSVADIQADAFWNCTNLHTVQVPAALAVVRDHAFSYCGNLRNFNFSQTALTTVETAAFSNATSLTIIHFPSTIQAVREVSFWGAASLTSVTFDPGAIGVVIGSGAFFSTPLTTLVFPNHTVFTPFAMTGIPTLHSVTAYAPARSEGTAFSGCACNTTCPAVVAGTDLRMCNCQPCANTTSLSPHTGTEVLGQLILFLATVPSAQLLAGVSDFIESNIVPNTTMTPADLNAIAEIADRLVRITFAIQIREYLGPATTTELVRLLTVYGALLRHLLSMGQANTVTVSGYISLVTNVSGLMTTTSLDETGLRIPVVDSLDQSLLNATEDLISLQSAGVHIFTSESTETRIEVWGSSLPQSTGGQYSHVFQISASDATFKIPVTSLTSSQPYIGASFSKYQTPALFKSNLNRSEVQVGSVVMAAQVTAKVTGFVEGVFNYRVNFNSSIMGNASVVPICVFYVPPRLRAGSSGNWSTTGCTTHYLNWSHVRCVCNHLTSFAVLVSSESRSDADSRALSVLTYIGISISLFGIVITLITVLGVEQLQQQLRYKILLNLAISMGMALISFTLITIPDTESGCHAVSFCSLYFFVATMLWSIVDAVDLYRTFVVVFNNGHGRQARFLSGYRVFAWGGALLPPTIAMLTDRDNFITPAHDSQPDWNTASSEHALCWINMSSDLKWAFLIPIFIVVTIGCTSTILIVRAIRQSTSHPAFRSGLYTAKLVLGISAVTGVTWIFAVLVVLFSDVAFSYLFAIFASTQGAALVYYHVMRNPLSRDLWRRSYQSLSSSNKMKHSRKYKFRKADRRDKNTTSSSDGSGPRAVPWAHKPTIETSQASKAHEASTRECLETKESAISDLIYGFYLGPTSDILRVLSSEPDDDDIQGRIAGVDREEDSTRSVSQFTLTANVSVV